jgi:hypothetical protein
MGKLIHCHMRDIYVVHTVAVVSALEERANGASFNTLAKWINSELHIGRIASSGDQLTVMRRRATPCRNVACRSPSGVLGARPMSGDDDVLHNARCHRESWERGVLASEA